MTDKEITICGHGSDNPSIKNLNAYSTYRYGKKASNGVRKGIVEVRRFTALDDNSRKMFHDKYKTIIGRNVYSQTLREYCYKAYNGKYYSDCSSSGMLTLREIGYTVSSLNTAGIHWSDKFETVDVKIVNGHIQNPEVLKVGDAILFAGSDPSRPLQIGHVEWVYKVPTTTTETSSSASESTCDVSLRVLKKGCKGNDVKLVQQMLISNGYDLGSYGADGDWGTKTDNAFYDWQYKNAKYVGSADRVCGKKCWAYILRK